MPRLPRLLFVLPWLLAAALVLPTRAHATVDGFLDYHVPYFHLQTGDICLLRQTMQTQFGIPGVAAMNGSSSPNQIFSDQPFFRYLNINIAATNPPMVPAYVSDAITLSGVWEFEMELDVSALAASNGPSLEGRTATVLAAKVFLLAMAANMELLSNRLYRLRLHFVGLPSQVGLPGTFLYPSTAFPYGVPSPLLALYRQQLLNREGSCPAR